MGEEKKDIVYYRSIIDDLDEGIVELLRARFAAAIEIGKLKKEQGLPCRDFQREAEIVKGMTPQERAVYGTLLFQSSQLQYHGRNGQPDTSVPQEPTQTAQDGTYQS